MLTGPSLQSQRTNQHRKVEEATTVDYHPGAAYLYVKRTQYVPDTLAREAKDP